MQSFWTTTVRSWTTFVPILGLALLLLTWGRHLPPALGALVGLVLAAPVLAAAPHPGLVPLVALILAGAVLAAVHHAEVVAHRVGEPFGSLVLAVAVTVIEV